MVQGVDFIMCQAYQTTASVNLKWIMVHELAHVVVTRLAAQKWHMWKMPHGLVPNIGEDTSPHGPIFQWIYELLIKRVEKIDAIVAEKCHDDLYHHQNMAQTDVLITSA
jgi:hypothetical protein